MNPLHRPLFLPLSLALGAALLLPLQAHAADETQLQIANRHTQERNACEPLLGNARDICREEAKGRERVAQAERVSRSSGSAADAYRLLVVRAESAYALSREQCDERSGSAKDLCIQEAKSTESKAMADAKLGKTVSEASHQAGETKRQADYKLAAEKCDTLSGDAKTRCVSSAKMQHRQ